MNIQDFKFGFEYETLINVNAKIYHDFRDYFKESRVYLQYCAVTGDEDVHKILLTSLLNNNNHGHNVAQYKAILGDEQQIICNLTLKPSNVDPNKAWIITSDRSVQYMIDEDEEYDPFYTTFESIRFPLPKPNYIISGIEIISPILSFNDIADAQCLLRQVIDRELLYNGTFTYLNNPSTSNHVHFSLGNAFQDPTNLLKLVMAWWYFEPLIMLTIGHWRRSNTFCKSLRRKMMEKLNSAEIEDMETLQLLFIMLGTKNFDLKKLIERFFTSPSYNGGAYDPPPAYDLQERTPEFYRTCIIKFFQGRDRYAALNLLNLLRGGIGTVEVRVKQGSSSGEENSLFIQWIAFLFLAACRNDIITTLYEGETFDLWEWYSFDFDTERETAFGVDINVWTNETSLPLSREVLDKAWNLFDRFMIMNLNHEERQIFEPVNQYFKDLTYRLHVAPSEGGSSTNDIWLFSYGSNHQQQLQQRIKRKAPIEHHTACLTNHTRVFVGYSQRWKGGIASVVPKKGMNVYGTLSQLSQDELVRLDKYETGYDKIHCKVFDKALNKEVDAVVYVCSTTIFQKPPSTRYIEAIHQMLSESHKSHKNKKIMIRALESGKIVTKGYWTPNEDIVLSQKNI